MVFNCYKSFSVICQTNFTKCQKKKNDCICIDSKICKLCPTLNLRCVLPLIITYRHLYVLSTDDQKKFVQEKKYLLPNVLNLKSGKLKMFFFLLFH